MIMRRKAKTEAEKLAAKMAVSFQEIAGKRLDDPTAKRFLIAFMLSLPTISGTEMNSIMSVFDRHLGIKQIDKTMETV